MKLQGRIRIRIHIFYTDLRIRIRIKIKWIRNPECKAPGLHFSIEESLLSIILNSKQLLTAWIDVRALHRAKMKCGWINVLPDHKPLADQ